VALAALESSSKAEPQSAVLHFLLVYEYAMIGEAENAQESVDRALKLDSVHVGVKALQAMVKD
jgi:Tfp pilus assembly protein PilF